MTRLTWTVILIASLFLVAGCEDDEQTELFKAQNCLDSATSATALACISSIEGQTSKTALVLRCSGRFLAGGIDTQAIVDAIEVISDEGNQANATSTAIANLAITSPTSATTFDLSLAQEISTICGQTGSDGLIALSAFALISTSTSLLLNGLAPCTATVPYTEQCVAQALDNFNPNTADSSTIGNTAIANQEALCGENGLFKGEDVCTDIDAAIAAGGNADAVGDAILNGIANDNN